MVDLIEQCVQQYPPLPTLPSYWPSECQRMSQAARQRLQLEADHIIKQTPQSLSEPLASCPKLTPLLLFVAVGDFSMVEAALEKGVDVNAQNARGTSALLLASMLGHVEVVRFLLAKGAKPLLRNHFQQTPVLVACARGLHAVLGALLQHIPEEDHPLLDGLDTSGYNALHYAISCGSLHCARSLLGRGAGVNVITQPTNTDYPPQSPLVLAVTRNDMSIFDELCQRDAQDRDGAYHMAMSFGFYGVLEKLQQRGYRPPGVMARPSSDTRFLLAAKQGNLPQFRLLWHEFRLGYQSRLPWNRQKHQRLEGAALMLAACYGQERIIAFLVARGVSTEQYGQGGCTPLDVAAYRGHLWCVHRLLCMADDSLVGIESAMHQAVQGHHPEATIKFLCTTLFQKRQVRSEDAYEVMLSALMKACHVNHHKVVMALLERLENRSNKRLAVIAQVMLTLASCDHLDLFIELDKRFSRLWLDEAGRSAGPIVLAAAQHHTPQILSWMFEQFVSGNKVVSLEKLRFKKICRSVQPTQHRGLVYYLALYGALPIFRALSCLTWCGEQLMSVADLNMPNVHGQTPLMAAAHGGHADVVSDLLHQGANPLARSVRGNTAMHVALMAAGWHAGQCESYALLAPWHEDFGATPCMRVDRDFKQVLRCFVKQPQALEQCNLGGLTLLALASCLGLIDMVKVLCDAGADLAARDLYENTVLMLALKCGQRGVVQYLLQRGVPLNPCNSAGYTALTFVCGMRLPVHVVKPLVQAITGTGRDAAAVFLLANARAKLSASPSLVWLPHTCSDLVLSFLVPAVALFVRGRSLRVNAQCWLRQRVRYSQLLRQPADGAHDHGASPSLPDMSQGEKALALLAYASTPAQHSLLALLKCRIEGARAVDAMLGVPLPPDKRSPQMRRLLRVERQPWVGDERHPSAINTRHTFFNASAWRHVTEPPPQDVHRYSH